MRRRKSKPDTHTYYECRALVRTAWHVAMAKIATRLYDYYINAVRWDSDYLDNHYRFSVAQVARYEDMKPEAEEPAF